MQTAGMPALPVTSRTMLLRPSLDHGARQSIATMTDRRYEYAQAALAARLRDLGRSTSCQPDGGRAETPWAGVRRPFGFESSATSRQRREGGFCPPRPARQLEVDYSSAKISAALAGDRAPISNIAADRHEASCPRPTAPPVKLVRRVAA